jgi:hypothetical protein
VHECGTARMGSDPATSVLDPHNQCWDAAGLYVTDSASFPSQGSQNPTLTVMACGAVIILALHIGVGCPKWLLHFRRFRTFCLWASAARGLRGGPTRRIRFACWKRLMKPGSAILIPRGCMGMGWAKQKECWANSFPRAAVALSSPAKRAFCRRQMA